MLDTIKNETDEQKAVAGEKTAAETKAAEEKAVEEKVETESDTTAEKLGADFDKKADEGEDHTAETAEEKEAKEKAEAEKAAKETKADEETGKEVPGKEVDESLLERAVRAGMSLERARKYGSKEDLEQIVELLEEGQSEKGKVSEESEAEKKAKEQTEADEAPYDCKLDPNEYDEGLIKGLNELGTMLKKRVVALETSLTKHAETLASDRVTKHTVWLDSMINRMSDDDLEKVYGKGDIDDIEEGSEQFKARAALDVKITKIANDLRDAKKAVPSRGKLFDMAIESLHKGKSTKTADAKTKAKLAERAKEAVGKGSSKVSAETAEAIALQANKDFDKEIDTD